MMDSTYFLLTSRKQGAIMNSSAPLRSMNRSAPLRKQSAIMNRMRLSTRNEPIRCSNVATNSLPKRRKKKPYPPCPAKANYNAFYGTAIARRERSRKRKQIGRGAWRGPVITRRPVSSSCSANQRKTSSTWRGVWHTREILVAVRIHTHEINYKF